MNKKKDKKSHEFSPKNLAFSIRRVMAIALKTINQFRRDRRTLGLLFVVPMAIMLIFGLAFSGEVQNLPVLIDNQDTVFGIMIEENLANDTRVELTTGDYFEGVEQVEKGDYYAAIFIPANFTQSILEIQAGNATQANIYLYLDGTKPTIKGSLLGALRDALEETLGGTGISVVQELAFGGAEFSGLDVGIPAVIAFVLIFLLVIVGVITIIREKIQGTQDRLYATPLRSSERLLGYVIGLLLIAMIMIALVLIFGVFVFGAKVQGNVFLLIFAALLFGLAHVFLAVFLANFAQNELQAIQFAPLTAIPSMALGGMMVPTISLPAWLYPVSFVVPLTYGINLFEGIMLKGWGFAELWVDFLVVGGMCLIFFILAVITVRNRMRD